MTLYFACGWVIRPDTDYDHLTHLAADVECELVAVAPIYMSNEGYAVMTFAVGVPSEAHLVKLIEAVGEEVGLTHWYSVTEDYFNRGKTLYLNVLPPEMREQWLAGMDAYGKHNAEVKRKAL